MTEYKTFKLISMGGIDNQVRDYFFDRKAIDLMKNGEKKQALEYVSSLYKDHKVGIEIITREVIYE